MVDWKVTATTIHCDAVGDEVTILVYKDGSVKCIGYDKYGKPRVSIISPSFKINEIIQALGRINRKGAKTPSLQRLIYCADTIEEAVCKNLRKKIDFLSK